MGSGLQQVIWGFLLIMAGFPALGLLGAGLVSLALLLFAPPVPPFSKCFKAYLSAVASSFLLICLVNFGYPDLDPVVLQGIGLVLCTVVQAIAIPLFLKRWARKELLAQSLAVLATNLVLFGVVITIKMFAEAG